MMPMMCVFSVTDGVYLTLFRTVQEVVNENAVVGEVLEDSDHAAFQFIVVDHDAHPLTTQYITGSYQHRVAYAVGHFQCFFGGGGTAIFRIGYFQFFQQVGENVPGLPPYPCRRNWCR